MINIEREFFKTKGHWPNEQELKAWAKGKFCSKCKKLLIECECSAERGVD